MFADYAEERGYCEGKKRKKKAPAPLFLRRLHAATGPRKFARFREIRVKPFDGCPASDCSLSLADRTYRREDTREKGLPQMFADYAEERGYCEGRHVGLTSVHSAVTDPRAYSIVNVVE